MQRNDSKGRQAGALHNREKQQFLGLQLTFEAKINFILGLGLAILIAVGTLSYRSIGDLVQTGRFESATLADLGGLEAAIASIKQVESAQRKFIITGSAEDLGEYRYAIALMRADRRGFFLQGGVHNDNPDQQRRLSQLGKLIDERLARLDETVKVRRQSGMEAAITHVRSAESAQVDQEIQRLADEFRTHEFRALRVRQEDTAFSADASSYLLFWGTAFAFMLLLWAMVVIHRNQVQRAAAEQALRDSEEQLRLITDAVPAFIGYADRDSHVRFHNKAFERWLGRTASRIRGYTLRNLIGDEAWAKLEPHVAEVLDGKPARCDFALEGPDGRMIDVSTELVPRRGDAGEIPGYYLLATDISALKEVDRLKSEFVTTVSHELRTPLTSIRGSLGLLAGGVTGPLSDKAKQLVNIATENCGRLVRLVTDILDSEKMLAGKMDMTIETLDLDELVIRSMRENDGFAATHGVKLAFDNAAPGVRANADRDRLVQVITNLLSNAIKFSPQGGTVDVILHRDRDTVRVTVADRGPGVPFEFQSRLFERFAQLDSFDSRRRGGTGLGLSICQGIIERLNGSIAYSPRSGGGSEFYFELPVRE